MAQNNGFTVWFTGMSGTGKTTLANYIAARLRQVDRNVEILDESEVRSELFQDYGDTKEERNTVVKRLGFISNLLTRNGVATLVPAVSPYKAGREENRRQIGRYIEVYVDCPTEKLIQRDSTGKYKKALHGEIPNFIGITEPYEPPNSPEVTIKSDIESVEESALRVFQSMLDLGYVTPDELKVITGKKMKANPENVKKARRAAPAAKPAPTKGSVKVAAKTRPAARSSRPEKPVAKKKGKR